NGLYGGAGRGAMAIPCCSPADCHGSHRFFPGSLNPSLRRDCRVGYMRYWICPNCGTRAADDDGRDGLSYQAVGCHHCGFGFLFELLEDFYPPANAGFVACDRDARVLSAGKGVFELTGYTENDLLGKHLVEVFGISGWADGQNPVDVVLEWGVR